MYTPYTSDGWNDPPLSSPGNTFLEDSLISASPRPSSHRRLAGVALHGGLFVHPHHHTLHPDQVPSLAGRQEWRQGVAV